MKAIAVVAAPGAATWCARFWPAAGPNPHGPGRSEVRPAGWQVGAAGLGHRYRSQALLCLAADGGLGPGGQVIRYRRVRNASQDGWDCAELSARPGAPLALGNVRLDPRGSARPQHANGQAGKLIRARVLVVPDHYGLSPGFRAGWRRPAGGQFSLPRSGTAGRRCASRGISRARPRVGRVFTVPAETQGTPAASAME
jgi:hypothetical protein